MVIKINKGSLLGVFVHPSLRIARSLQISVQKTELLAINNARYQQAFTEQKQNLQNIQNVLTKTYIVREQLVPVRIFPDSPNLSTPSTTNRVVSLVYLFAKEQVKLELANTLKPNNGE